MCRCMPERADLEQVKGRLLQARQAGERQEHADGKRRGLYVHAQLAQPRLIRDGSGAEACTHG